MPKAPKDNSETANSATHTAIGEAHEAISSPTLELIELFADALPDVAFPGVDSSSLDELAGRVRAESQRAAAAQAELDSAREGLASARKDLRDASKLALGYAKVYAQQDAPLLARLKNIRLIERKLAPQRKRRNKDKPSSPASMRVI